MKISDETPVFYQPGKPGIIDLALDRDGIMRGIYSGETLEEMRLRYPAAEIGELGPVAKASDDHFRHGPVEITEDQFDYALEVLPPEDFVVRNGASTFKMCEYTSGRITAIYASIRGRYYELADDFALSHDAILAKIAEVKS